MDPQGFEIREALPRGLQGVGGAFVELDDPVYRMRQGPEYPRDIEHAVARAPSSARRGRRARPSGGASRSAAPAPRARPPGRRRRSGPSRRRAARRCRGASDSWSSRIGRSPSTGSNSHQWLCMPNSSPRSRARAPAWLHAETRSRTPARESNRGSRGQPCQMIFEHRHAPASPPTARCSRPWAGRRGSRRRPGRGARGSRRGVPGPGPAAAGRARRRRSRPPSPGPGPGRRRTPSRPGSSRAGVPQGLGNSRPSLAVRTPNVGHSNPLPCDGGGQTSGPRPRDRRRGRGPRSLEANRRPRWESRASPPASAFMRRPRGLGPAGRTDEARPEDKRRYVALFRLTRPPVAVIMRVRGKARTRPSPPRHRGGLTEDAASWVAAWANPDSSCGRSCWRWRPRTNGCGPGSPPTGRSSTATTRAWPKSTAGTPPASPRSSTATAGRLQPWWAGTVLRRPGWSSSTPSATRP